MCAFPWPPFDFFSFERLFLILLMNPSSVNFRPKARGKGSDMFLEEDLTPLSPSPYFSQFSGNDGAEVKTAFLPKPSCIALSTIDCLEHTHLD